MLSVTTLVVGRKVMTKNIATANSLRYDPPGAHEHQGAFGALEIRVDGQPDLAVLAETFAGVGSVLLTKFPVVLKDQRVLKVLAAFVAVLVDENEAGRFICWELKQGNVGIFGN